ncbi:helix-turn-helix domain-containing protein [Brevibacterium sp. R8603A2]|uniref:helix-turn-helix domain-containing protein n=1 Tax=Brevibacterium sp. R8603A2 TaxID=2929779 RepID=UPI001FF79979|nr:helix-turn-helix domain-containing protein [Brevibacterium sp. R8603A2]MCK1801487.1 helix-turn-helix domain-containing protein [Brevibacterium sp. R8603A2]
MPTKITPELTIAQAAEITGTSAPTIRRWISNGELRAYRYGKRVIRIAYDDLMKLRREVNPTTFTKQNGGDVA